MLKAPFEESESAVTSRVAPTRASAMLVVVVALAFLGSIAGIHFVTLDDRWYAAWVWNDEWLADAYSFAGAHGRLLKPSSYTYYFPYLFDSAIYQACLRLGTIAISAWLAGILLQRMLRGHGTALLFIVFFFAFAQNSYDHNPFTAYPFAWEFSWICWMLGLLGLMVAIERQRMAYAIAGMVIWLIGLQEGFVPHTAVFVAVVMVLARDGKRSWRYLLPYLVALAVWIVLWIAWRAKHPSNYEGSKFALDSIGDVVRSTVNYSVGGMPMATVLNGQVVLTFHDIARSLDALMLIKALAVFLVVFELSVPASRAEIFRRWRRLAFAALVLLALAVLPNLLVGMTPKYQEWARYGVHAYLYSHFSYFAWTALGTLVVLFVVSRWSSRVLVGALAFAAALGSVATDAANADVNRLQEQFGRRWQTMDKFFASAEFRSIPDQSGIWMVDASVTGKESNDALYWQKVIKARTGKKVAVSAERSAALAAKGGAYYLYLYDEPKTENQYVLLARLDQGDAAGDRNPRRFSVVTNSPNDQFHIGGRLTCIEPGCLASINVDGHAGPMLFDSLFSVAADTRKSTDGTAIVELEGAAGVDVRTLHVDFARNAVAALPAVVLATAKGFLIAPPDAPLRWADVDAELAIHSEVDRVLDVQVGFTVAATDIRTIVVTDAHHAVLARVTTGGPAPAEVRLPMAVAKGTTSIFLHTDEAAPRRRGDQGLAFQVGGLRLDLEHPP